MTTPSAAAARQIAHDLQFYHDRFAALVLANRLLHHARDQSPGGNRTWGSLLRVARRP